MFDRSAGGAAGDDPPEPAVGELPHEDQWQADAGVKVQDVAFPEEDHVHQAEGEQGDRRLRYIPAKGPPCRGPVHLDREADAEEEREHRVEFARAEEGHEPPGPCRPGRDTARPPGCPQGHGA